MELASSLFADDPGQIVLSRKCNNHFGGTRSMAVDEENHASVEVLAAQALRLKYYGYLGQNP